MQPPPGDGGDLGQASSRSSGHPARLRGRTLGLSPAAVAAIAAASSSASSNGSVDAADLLPGLVALARDDDRVAGPRGGDGGGDGLAAVADLAAPRRGAVRPRAPASTAARMSAGSSERGLSSVTTSRSARAAAAAPISGRLARSRSPPAPSTTSSRPGDLRRAARRAARRRRRACARSRRPRGTAARARPAASGPGTATRARPSAATAGGTPAASRQARATQRVGDVERRPAGAAAPARRPCGVVRGEVLRAVGVGHDVAGPPVGRGRRWTTVTAPGVRAASRTPHSSSTQITARSARPARTATPSPRSSPPCRRGSRGGPATGW